MTFHMAYNTMTFYDFMTYYKMTFFMAYYDFYDDKQVLYE